MTLSRFTFVFLTFLVACSAPNNDQSPSVNGETGNRETGNRDTSSRDTSMENSVAVPESESHDRPLERIVIPVSIFIVDDKSGQVSSLRTEQQLEEVYERVNAIWDPAGIVIDVQHIQRITLPPSILQPIMAGDFRPFFNPIENDLPVTNLSLINGFYTREIGGPNGIVPFRSRVFFVNDNPTVHDERVSAHEIGHILGLHHTLEDDGRLMFPGTNGMALTDEEIGVARYVAKGMLDRLR